MGHIKISLTTTTKRKGKAGTFPARQAVFLVSEANVSGALEQTFGDSKNSDADKHTIGI